MSVFSIDIEANGRIPGKHSMTEFGIVKVDKEKTFPSFHGKVKPMYEEYVPDCLAISGVTFEETKLYGDPKEVMQAAVDWVWGKQHRPSAKILV